MTSNYAKPRMAGLTPFVRKSLAIGAMVSGLALAAGEASAQQPATPPASDSAEAEGEIIVTANRREESLTRVPMSVQAFGVEDLDKLNVRQIGDIARVSPGLVLNFQIR